MSVLIPVLSPQRPAHSKSSTSCVQRTETAITDQCWGKGGEREIHGHSLPSELPCPGEKAPETRGTHWPPGRGRVLVTLTPGSHARAASEASLTQLKRQTVTANIS